MTRPHRRCLGLPGIRCDELTRNPGGRCRRCEQAFQRIRNQKRTQYAGGWKRLSQKAREEEPWCHRPGCPNPHTSDLTFDHETGTVECRPCNSSHRRNRA